MSAVPIYKYTPEAWNELKNILDYTIKNWGKAQASKYIDGLEELSENLSKNPDLGKNRDTLQRGLLSFRYQSHVLYYLKIKNGIIIVHVLHERMHPKKYLN